MYIKHYVNQNDGSCSKRYCHIKLFFTIYMCVKMFVWPFISVDSNKFQKYFGRFYDGSIKTVPLSPAT